MSPRMTAAYQTLVSSSSVTSPMTHAVGARKAVGCKRGMRRRYYRKGGNCIWVQAATGVLPYIAGCHGRLQTKVRASRSNAWSVDLRKLFTSMVRPSAETLTQSTEGVGDTSVSTGTGTKGWLTGFGRSS